MARLTFEVQTMSNWRALPQRPFGSGDPLWALSQIDPRFEPRDLISEAVERGAPVPIPLRRKRRGRAGSAVGPLALVALLLEACGGHPSAPSKATTRLGDSILVQLHKDDATLSLRGADGKGLPILPLSTVGPQDQPALLRVPVPAGSSPEAYAEELRTQEGIDFAEPIYVYKTSARRPGSGSGMPDDPRLKDLWGLSKINAPAAWKTTTGDRKVTVAVVDDGVAIAHPDLQDNLWVNPGETPDNGVDDDGDGLIDDVHGWDFVDNKADPTPPEEGDAPWHGTHVSGTIGAAGNNGIGVVGVNWQVSLMGLRALGPDGGRADQIVQAIDYAVEHGAKVINASWGGGGASQAISKAVERAQKQGVLFVAAAGNDAADQPSFPADLPFDNLISVGATGPDDTLADFSNRAAMIAAPGVGILSTTAPGQYERYDGTSMAAPHVSGLAALLWSAKPDATVDQIRSAILTSGAPVEGAQGGRIDAQKALAALGATSGGGGGGGGGSAGDLKLSRDHLEFKASGKRKPRAKSLQLKGQGGATLDWTAQADQAWIALSDTSGSTPSRLKIKVDPTGLPAGDSTGHITISSGDQSTSVTVTLSLADAPAAATALSTKTCSAVDGVVHVAAGRTCALAAPADVASASTLWELPGGATAQGPRFFARFLSPGRFSLRVSDGDVAREVQVLVE